MINNTKKNCIYIADYVGCYMKPIQNLIFSLVGTDMKRYENVEGAKNIPLHTWVASCRRKIRNVARRW